MRVLVGPEEKQMEVELVLKYESFEPGEYRYPDRPAGFVALGTLRRFPPGMCHIASERRLTIEAAVTNWCEKAHLVILDYIAMYRK